MALGIAAVPLARFAAGCDNDSGSTGVDAATGDANTVDAPSGDGWASGGTAAMTDKANYPDPFTGALSSCVIVASTTAGPCTTATDLVREDVSEGWAGIPVRFALKVVNASCNPVASATVKIWHTNVEGVYSGQTPSPAFCSNNDQAAISMNYMRGVQTTNADGVVYFDTCYPGWYPGRAIHIHFQVANGPTVYRVSQLFFPEDVTREIFADHVDYREFGQPNTTFSNDGVIAPITGEARNRLVMDVARMTDGAMLASKVVTVM
jgi:protocatechuate 3,4-dioxygenase beta subunit